MASNRSAKLCVSAVLAAGLITFQTQAAPPGSAGSPASSKPYSLPSGSKPASSKESTEQEILQRLSKALVAIGKDASRALVFISVYGDKRTDEAGVVDPFRHFFSPSLPKNRKTDQKPAGGLGSGFFVDLPNGYILTNNHVVKDAGRISLKLANGKTYNGRIIGRDHLTDLAVLAVEENNVDLELTTSANQTPATLIDSRPEKPADFDRRGLAALSLAAADQLAVGDFVLALGAPFGLEASLSFGIVSALGRGNLDITALGNFIQTDAAINPGNSGGPLLNTDGRVVGVNTAIYTRSGGYNGIGFAVPAGLVRSVAERLINDGGLRRGYLGVYLQPLDDELRQGLSIPESVTGGALVTRIADQSPAQRSGLEPGDVIDRAFGKLVRNQQDLVNIVGLVPPGGEVAIGFIRNSKRQQITMKVAEHPEDIKERLEGGRLSSPDADPFVKDRLFGLTLQPLNDKLRRRHGIDAKRGLYLVSVAQGSPALQSGLRPGDVITKVGRYRVATVKDFLRYVQSDPSQTIVIERDTKNYIVQLKN